MMNTYWVSGKRPKKDGIEEDLNLNPLQLEQKDKAMRSTSRRVTLPTPSISPAHRLLQRQNTFTQGRSHSIASPSPLLEHSDQTHIRKPSPAPDEWPELEKAIRESSSPSPFPPTDTPAAVCATVAKQGIALAELSDLELPMQASLPEELQALVAENGKDLSLDEYAKLAEENAKLAEESAQKSRKLANWLADVASAVKEQENERNTAETREAGNCVIL